MQFNPPQGFMFPFQQNQPYHQFMHNFPAFQQNYGNSLNIPTQPIGEGDVVPTQYPDGTLQFYFVPRLLYQQKQCFCANMQCICNNSIFQYNSMNAWLIRSVANIVSPQLMSVPPHVFSPPQAAPHHQAMTWQEQVVFHNDAATSATDLHYFCPRPRPAARPSGTAACAQTNRPAVRETQTSACDAGNTGGERGTDNENSGQESRSNVNRTKSRIYTGVASFSSSTCACRNNGYKSC